MYPFCSACIRKPNRNVVDRKMVRIVKLCISSSSFVYELTELYHDVPRSLWKAINEFPHLHIIGRMKTQIHSRELANVWWNETVHRVNNQVSSLYIKNTISPKLYIHNNSKKASHLLTFLDWSRMTTPWIRLRCSLPVKCISTTYMDIQ